MWLVETAYFVLVVAAAAYSFALRQNQSRARIRARCRLWRARLYGRRLAREGGVVGGRLWSGCGGRLGTPLGYAPRAWRLDGVGV